MLYLEILYPPKLYSFSPTPMLLIFHNNDTPSVCTGWVSKKPFQTQPSIYYMPKHLLNFRNSIPNSSHYILKTQTHPKLILLI